MTTGVYKNSTFLFLLLQIANFDTPSRILYIKTEGVTFVFLSYKVTVGHLRKCLLYFMSHKRSM